MAELVTIKTKAPVLESITVKLSKHEAEELVSVYEQARARRPYYFDIFGGKGAVHTAVENALLTHATKKQDDPVSNGAAVSSDFVTFAVR